MKNISHSSILFRAIFFIYFILLNSISIFAQEEPQVIELDYNIDGFSNEPQMTPFSIPSDTTATIKAEMKIGDSGIMNYFIPLEILKGVNNFQPNISLFYSSQSGSGIAGWGWNVSGLSMISKGGKSKLIDGITMGPQYSSAEPDPIYLDGERLLTTNLIDYVTEKYSAIKIKMVSNADASYIVKYPDGKIAKYKEIVAGSGQHYITQVTDAMGYVINYTYTASNNVASILVISYGGMVGESSNVQIRFDYESKNLNLAAYRNGVLYRNRGLLKAIRITSSFLPENSGLYRQYILHHDKIQLGSADRLIKVEVKNNKGYFLKPLQFTYNDATGSKVSLRPGYFDRLETNVKGLGNVVTGDFLGTGKPYPVYEVKLSATGYKLYNPWGGIQGDYGYSRQLFAGKILNYGRITESDILISLESENLINSDNDRLTFRFHESAGAALHRTCRVTLPGFRLGSIREPNQRKVITGDFNNDGLIDVFIFQPKGTHPSIMTPQPGSGYFIELGKANNGDVIPIEINIPDYDYTTTSIYQVDFDGDGINEIMTVRPSGACNVYKFNTTMNYLSQIAYTTIPSYTDKTPLIFGDYNGDGLTDFITPLKVYNIENSNSAAQLQKMETETLLWREFISTGVGFTERTMNLTSQGIAYIAPSQRDIIDRSSGWEKFWSGKHDQYQYTEYGTSSVIPVDINNDGRTDLVSFRKFGKVKYDSNLWKSTVNNDNPAGSSTANKVFFHINTIVTGGTHGERILVNLPTTLPLNTTRISPFSIIVNSGDFNSLNTYKSTLTIYDPLTERADYILINNDEFSEGMLQGINNGSGVTQKIEYRPMTVLNYTNTSKTYTAVGLNLMYPYFVHKNNGIFYLTDKVHTLFDDKIITSEYRYENAVQHLEGKGLLGFQKTFCSDPYESIYEDGKYRMKDLFAGHYWTVKTFDPTRDNVLISSAYGSLNPGSVFSRTEYNYNTITIGNRYTHLLDREGTNDYLKGTIIEKTYTYDENHLLKELLTILDLDHTTKKKISYWPESNNGENYFYGKIKDEEVISTNNNGTFSTKEEYTYNPTGTLLQVKKYGNNTPAITTDYTYYPYGEKQTETINTTGLAAALVTSYTYDTTKRYPRTTTSPDGLVYTWNYNRAGLLLSETTPLGLVTSYGYDSWGTLKQVTNYLGKKTFITRVPAQTDNGLYSISTVPEGGAEAIVTYDKFDRPIESKTKSLNNQWVINRKEYDIFGKVTRESEPFYEGGTIQWNTIGYDELNRPVVNTHYTGRVTTTCYEKLKITVEDGHKKIINNLDAAGNIKRHEDSGGVITYQYYPNGALKQSNYNGIITSVEIDGWGNKKKLTDPSAGIYQYQYDNLSRVIKETNPKGGITQYVYNAIGLLESETTASTTENTNITKSYTYNSKKLPTVISGTYNGKSYTYTTYYDNANYRVTGKKEQTPDFTYQTTIAYDEFGRTLTTELKTILNNPNFTTTSQIKNIYDSNGLLIKQINPVNSKLIWELQEATALGMAARVKFGNDYIATTTYSATTNNIENINHSKGTSTVVSVNYSYDDAKGLLLYRKNFVFPKSEAYEYDGLDRLVKEKVNGAVAQEYTYDNRGRMTSNTSMGKYNYANNNYRLESINFNTNGNTANAARGFAQVKYNAFKSPDEIFLEGKDRLSYDYSILRTRSAAYYGNENADATQRPNRKFYSADQAVEVIKEGTVTKIITYLTGTPYSANCIKIDELNNGSLTGSSNYYLHRDNQGTILAITKDDATGTVIEKRYFDAWGNLKQVMLGNASTPTNVGAMGWAPQLLIDRGYTGHEHLKSTGLIHMNGRIYDPLLRRFLSPDNFVQDAYNTQNFNRYGYVLNNPLLYTDPSGEEIITTMVVAVTVAIIANGVNNVMHNTPFWYGMGKAAATAAVTSAIGFGIGAAQSAVFNTAKAIAPTLKEAALAGLGNLLGSFIPSVNVINGADISLSLNAAILLGNTNGLGLNVDVSYTPGDLEISCGFGAIGFDNYNNTGKSGVQYRGSLLLSYDDGRTGGSLGSNTWFGEGGMKIFEQRTGIIKGHFGDFRFTYENDGAPFGKKDSKWRKAGDGNDSYRTAAASLSIGKISAGFNLFTGERSNYRGDKIEQAKGSQTGYFGERMPFGFVKEEGTRYRMGAAYISYNGLRAGIDSDRYVRHPIQDILAHAWLTSQPGFRTYSDEIIPYIQYQSINKFTSW